MQASLIPVLSAVVAGAIIALVGFGLRARLGGFHADVFHEAPTAMYVWEPARMRIIDANRAALERFGYARDEFLALKITDLRPPEDVPLLLRALENQDTSSYGVWRHLTKDKRTLYSAIHKRAIRYRGRAAWLVYALDVTSQHKTEQQLRASEATLELAQEVAHLGSFIYDYRAGQGSCSAELCRMLHVQPGELKQGDLWSFDHPEDAARVREEVESARAERRQYKSDHRFVLRDGTILYAEERGYWTYDQAGEPVCMFGTVLDITERKASEAALAHVAFHDPLTNLLNRAGLRDHLSSAIRERRAAGLMPIFFFDLDRFKTVNDTLGHVVGDQLIVEIGRRLARHLRIDEVLARTGGDEFIIVSPPMPDRANISLRARELLDAFGAPFTIAGLEHTVSASLGISVFPFDAQEADALLRNADVAMYAAKAHGGGTFHYYTAELQRGAEQRFRMESALRRAMEKGEFTLHYQPVVCARSGRISAVEALLRWNDPEAGPISPAAFIPLAEETGFIRRIGAWVFEQAFAQAKRWADAGMALTVWVNVSASQLHDASLPHVIADLLRAHELDGSLIGLELTESSFINHERDVLATLNQIRALDVHLALDDFGVKYSSLEYLQRLPITNVKIDRVFVNDLANNPFNASIVRAIVNVAHDVGFRVTAEGVESAAELAFLQRLSCDDWQGFLFSTAQAPEQIDAMMEAQVHYASS